MIDATILSIIAGSITILSSVVIVAAIYLHRRTKRAAVWETPTNAQSVTNSAPISRRSSSSCLINLEKRPQPSRSRSASFGEDLTARLQILAAGSSYRSFASATINPSPRSNRSSLGAPIRFPVVSNISSTITTPTKPATPTITFQLRYEQTIETIFITIFQLQNYLSSKNSQSVFLILYLLPNDDEQRQTPSSTTGVFNEHYQFPLKSDDLFKRTLRLTAYTVDSTTRIRHVLGHVFIKLEQFINENKSDKTFSTNTLTECLIQDLQIRSDYLGEVILTNSYIKNQNLIQIRIQQINNLNIEQSKIKTPLKAYFSGQITKTSHKHHWINTSTFIIHSSTSSFRIDQELNLSTHSSVIPPNEDHIECRLRLHLHGFNQIHSHARWEQSLQSNLSHTLTLPLVAL